MFTQFLSYTLREFLAQRCHLGDETGFRSTCASAFTWKSFYTNSSRSRLRKAVRKVDLHSRWSLLGQSQSTAASLTIRSPLVPATYAGVTAPGHAMWCLVMTAKPANTDRDIMRDSDEEDRDHENFLLGVDGLAEFGETQIKFELFICHIKNL